MTETMLGYPTGWTLAVLDDADEALAAVSELTDSGLATDDVALVVSPDDTETFKRLGASSGVAARLRRTMQFLTMDQMPDLHVYELALDDGRPVVGVRVEGEDARRAAVEVLRRHRAHFINRFGAWATEEIASWRGTMPHLPQHLQR